MTLASVSVTRQEETSACQPRERAVEKGTRCHRRASPPHRAVVEVLRRVRSSVSTTDPRPGIGTTRAKPPAEDTTHQAAVRPSRAMWTSTTVTAWKRTCASSSGLSYHSATRNGRTSPAFVVGVRSSDRDPVVAKTRRIQEDHVQVLTRDDSTHQNMSRPTFCNKVQVICTPSTRARSNRYGVTILVQRPAHSHRTQAAR